MPWVLIANELTEGNYGVKEVIKVADLTQVVKEILTIVTKK